MGDGVGETGMGLVMLGEGWVEQKLYQIHTEGCSTFHCMSFSHLSSEATNRQCQ